MIPDLDLTKMGFHWEVDPNDSRSHRFTNNDITLCWVRHGFDIDKGQYSFKVGETEVAANGRCFIETLDEAKEQGEKAVRAYIRAKEVGFTKAYTFLKRVNQEPDLHRLQVNY